MCVYVCGGVRVCEGVCVRRGEIEATPAVAPAPLPLSSRLNCPPSRPQPNPPPPLSSLPSFPTLEPLPLLLPLQIDINNLDATGNGTFYLQTLKNHYKGKAVGSNSLSYTLMPWGALPSFFDPTEKAGGCQVSVGRGR